MDASMNINEATGSGVYVWWDDNINQLGTLVQVKRKYVLIHNFSYLQFTVFNIHYEVVRVHL